MDGSPYEARGDQDCDLRSWLAATVDWHQRNTWWWRPQKEATETRYRMLGR